MDLLDKIGSISENSGNIIINNLIFTIEGANKVMKAIQCLSGMLEFIVTSSEKKKMFMNLAGKILIFIKKIFFEKQTIDDILF